MIDEKKLIEEIEYMIGILPTYYINKKDEENAYLDAINRVLSAVKRQPKVGEWISVEEGMPEEHDSIFAKFKGTDLWKNSMFSKVSNEVNVTFQYGDGPTKISTSYTFDGVWKIEKERKMFGLRVIAWMPKPTKDGYRMEGM